jgi:hypothetical protein
LAMPIAKNSSHSCWRNIAPPSPKARGGPQGAGGERSQAIQVCCPMITTDVLFAAKVQRKLSNGAAQLAAA